MYIALDFFDASINRIAAWVIGTRATQKGDPVCAVGTAGKAARGGTRGRYDRLALVEEMKNMPVNAVWDYYCEKSGVPSGWTGTARVKQYEKDVLLKS